jgi:hypothetical protein
MTTSLEVTSSAVSGEDAGEHTRIYHLPTSRAVWCQSKVERLEAVQQHPHGPDTPPVRSRGLGIRVGQPERKAFETPLASACLLASSHGIGGRARRRASRGECLGEDAPPIRGGVGQAKPGALDHLRAHLDDHGLARQQIIRTYGVQTGFPAKWPWIHAYRGLGFANEVLERRGEDGGRFRRACSGRQRASRNRL